MVNRRDFFSGFIGSRKAQPNKVRPARTPRYKDLETYVIADLIPYDLHLTSAEDLQLRERVRATMYTASDEDLFSMSIIRTLEKLAEEFVAEMDRARGAGAGPTVPQSEADGNTSQND